jgi:hypothetical protein
MTEQRDEKGGLLAKRSRLRRAGEESKSGTKSSSAVVVVVVRLEK